MSKTGNLLRNVVNWLALIAIILGFGLFLAGFIYVSAAGDADALYWSLTGAGLGIFVAGLLVIVIAHGKYILGNFKRDDNDYKKVSKDSDKYKKLSPEKRRKYLEENDPFKCGYQNYE